MNFIKPPPLIELGAGYAQNRVIVENKTTFDSPERRIRRKMQPEEEDKEPNAELIQYLNGL